MFSYYSLVSLLFCQFLLSRSTPILSEASTHLADENNFDDTHHTFLIYLKTLLEETNPAERNFLLNQLREQLNRLCISGYFGPSHGDACQHVVDIIHQNYLSNHYHEEENLEASNESHGIQKRFFCNGFIGCKSVSG